MEQNSQSAYLSDIKWHKGDRTPIFCQHTPVPHKPGKVFPHSNAPASTRARAPTHFTLRWIIILQQHKEWMNPKRMGRRRQKGFARWLSTGGERHRGLGPGAACRGCDDVYANTLELRERERETAARAGWKLNCGVAGDNKADAGAIPLKSCSNISRRSAASLARFPSARWHFTHSGARRLGVLSKRVCLSPFHIGKRCVSSLWGHWVKRLGLFYFGNKLCFPYYMSYLLVKWKWLPVW